MSVTGLVVGGATIGGLQAIELGGSRASAEREVFKVVSDYGTARSVRRTEGKNALTRIKVQMESQEAFARTFASEKGAPFERIHAAGNNLRFQHQGVEFLLENVA